MTDRTDFTTKPRTPAEKMREIEERVAALERLPAWAKPVMRAVKRWNDADDANGWNGMREIMTEHRKLTETQLKEIGEDDD